MKLDLLMISTDETAETETVEMESGSPRSVGRYIARGLAVLLFVQIVVSPEVVDIPRTSTAPVIEDPPFPYADPADVGVDAAVLERLDDEVASWVASGDLVGGELLIVKRGKTIWHEAYGWADVEARRPAVRNSLWSIKSMTKPVTAAAVMQLVEAGELSLNDHLIDFIPEFVGDPRTTLGHLLSHTSGYRNSDYGDPRPEHESLEQWVRSWAKTSPTGRFGEYEYADFGYGAAGYLVQRVTGMTIEEYTRRHLLEPLGMDDTCTAFSDDPGWRSRLNAWYRWDPSLHRYLIRWRTDRRPWGIYAAAWGLFSTATDYARFLAVFLDDGQWRGHRVVSASSVDAMLKPHGFVDGKPVYGYGWFVSPGATEDSGPSRFVHGGGDGTMAAAWPADDLMVIFLTHSRAGTHRQALLNRIAIWGLADAPPASGMVRAEAFEHDLAPLDPDAASAYHGTYRASTPESPEEDMLIQVSAHGDHLRAWQTRFGRQTGSFKDLAHLGDGVFAPGGSSEEGWGWLDPKETIRFNMLNDRADSLTVVSEGAAAKTYHRVDRAVIDAEIARRRTITPVEVVVGRAVANEGLEAARTLSRDLHQRQPETVGFSVRRLDALGHSYLMSGYFEVGVAVLEMNAEAYPDEPLVYDSLADAWMSAGELEKARSPFPTPAPRY